MAGDRGTTTSRPVTALISARCRFDGPVLLLVGAVTLMAATSRATAQEAREDREADVFRTTIRPTEPLTPDQEQQTFVVPEGFEVHLVASEPDIAKPMNLAFDARGRIWLTDSVEYPVAVPPERAGRDSVKVLEDTNQDGQIDRITTFADGLNIPIGLYPYGDGVICFSIPDILFLRDTDGDGRADRREKLIGPFDTSRDTHGMCNAFTRGFDGWLYGCHGFNNQSHVAGRDGHAVALHSGNTFRLRLDGSRIERFTRGQVNPFGLSFNRRGDLFSADCHTKPVTLLLEGGCYESFGRPHDGLGFVPAVMEHLHGSTAIGGICLVEDDHWPGEYSGNSFGGNVMTGCINRNEIVYAGSSVQARKKPDFLCSGDPWFRPVDLQIGPDGCLYIADFYNRIIGHYEVPLDHPGRDRHRGRVWKIIPPGGEDRQDPQAVRGGNRDLTQLDPRQLVDELDVSNLTRRMLITDQLSDRHGSDAIVPVRSALRDTSRPVAARVHGLWVLHRLGAVTEDDLRICVDSSSPDELRLHGFRVLAATGPGHSLLAHSGSNAAPWIVAGLFDPEPVVRRAAVPAAGRHRNQNSVELLIRLFHATPEADVHLRHAVRMALRDCLRDDSEFDRLEFNSLTVPDRRLIAEICLALDSSVAGEFLLRSVVADPHAERQWLTGALRHIAETVSAPRLATVAGIAERRFPDDWKFQRELLTAVRNGLGARGTTDMAIREWAGRLAKKLLHLDADPGTVATDWIFLPHPGKPNRGNPWVVSDRRQSADGHHPTVLFSSFPRGERWTGIYRSATFTAGESFSFWAAGHTLRPGTDGNVENFIRMREAGSHRLLFEATPPRQDTAQRMVWDTSAVLGQPVYIELVDGNSDSAYAWLAAGRFSELRLNPSQVPDDRQEAASLIEAFRLTELQSDVRAVLRQSAAWGKTASMLARALASFSPDTRLTAVAELPDMPALPEDIRRRAAAAVVEDDSSRVQSVLTDAMRTAASPDQQRIAEQLAMSSRGMQLLLELVERGVAGPGLLTLPPIAQKFSAGASRKLSERRQKLTEQLPAEDAGLTQLIAQRRSEFDPRQASADTGAELFRRHCSNCHQVAGAGKKVGPNLDGIGNRGPDRLFEDILAPNRNVDVAFRATTIVTMSGRILNGLIRRTEGRQVVLVNSQGEEQTVAMEDIEQQIPSVMSVMPANFAQSVSADDLQHLMAYLLSLRGDASPPAGDQN